MSQAPGEIRCTTIAYRPWSVKVPIALDTSRFSAAHTPKWVSIRAANIIETCMQERLAAGEPVLSGFIDCQLLVVPGVRGGFLTVVFSNNTVKDRGLAFAQPGDLQAELIRIAADLMRGFGEREAIVECHGMVTHLESTSSRTKVSS